MRRCAMVGLGVLAGMVVGGGLAASASAAAPELGRCVKKSPHGGAGFSDKQCTNAVTSGGKRVRSSAIFRGLMASENLPECGMAVFI